MTKKKPSKLSEKNTSLDKINQELAEERARWDKRSAESIARIKQAFSDKQIKDLRNNYPLNGSIDDKLAFVNAFNKKNKKLKGDYPVLTLTGIAALLSN